MIKSKFGFLVLLTGTVTIFASSVSFADAFHRDRERCRREEARAQFDDGIFQELSCYHRPSDVKRDLSSSFESATFDFHGEALAHCGHREWDQERCRVERENSRSRQEERKYDEAKEACRDKIDAMVGAAGGISAEDRYNYECYDLQWHKKDDKDSFYATMAIMYTSPKQKEKVLERRCTDLKECYAKDSKSGIEHDRHFLERLVRKSSELGCPGTVGSAGGRAIEGGGGEDAAKVAN